LNTVLAAIPPAKAIEGERFMRLQTEAHNDVAPDDDRACPICGSTDLEEIHGSEHCAECGCIVDEYYANDDEAE
jgi:hypothetical protein